MKVDDSVEYELRISTRSGKDMGGRLIHQEWTSAKGNVFDINDVKIEIIKRTFVNGKEIEEILEER